MEEENEELKQNLLAMALRKVDDVSAGRRKVHQRASTGLPELRVHQALLLCSWSGATHNHPFVRSMTKNTGGNNSINGRRSKLGDSDAGEHRERERSRLRPSEALGAAVAAGAAPAPLVGVFMAYIRRPDGGLISAS